MKNKALFIELDNTIIKTRSKKTFPVDKDDWEFIPKTSKYIKDKLNDHYIILATNQGGISKGYLKMEDFIDKLDSIQSKMGFEFDKVFIATSLNSDLRKPQAFRHSKILEREFPNIDYNNSVMVGDAGGRIGDFSDSDLKWANNMGVNFLHVDDI